MEGARRAIAVIPTTAARVLYRCLRSLRFVSEIQLHKNKDGGSEDHYYLQNRTHLCHGAQLRGEWIVFKLHVGHSSR